MSKQDTFSRLWNILENGRTIAKQVFRIWRDGGVFIHLAFSHSTDSGFEGLPFTKQETSYHVFQETEKFSKIC
jgi:hypothetical protein